MSPRSYDQWHQNSWKVIRIENHPGVGTGDTINFSAKAGGTTISSVTCSHGTHGSYWNGVDCTGHPTDSSRADGSTKISATAFDIESSIDSSTGTAKEVLICNITKNLPAGRESPAPDRREGGGACWIAEEQP